MNGHTNGQGSSPTASAQGKKPLQKKESPSPHIDREILGPVTDLEEHVRRDWWRRIFNSLYLRTDGDVVEDDRITRTEIDLFLGILQLKQDDKVLDLCCGQGRHSRELARRGYRSVEGLDRSHYLIQRARTSAKTDGLTIKFREGDARKIPFASDNFDHVVILGNSFGYFDTVHDDLRVLRQVFRVLKPWGKLLIDLPDGDFLKKNFQARSWEWIDKKYFVCRERSLSADGQRLISREVISHVEKGVIADQFYAERLYSQEGIKKLFQDAGFTEVAFHGTMKPDSQRDQDLGMMERRLIVSGVVRKEWAPQRRNAKEHPRDVVVLLGDPTKPDARRPKQVFDDDDFYTIDQLKEALRELKDYRFTYLDKHDQLMADLKRYAGKGDLVLNLCEEGFKNTLRKAMHVPALLEMLEIPYAGSGPECLAHAFDKSLVRGVAQEMGIPVPSGHFIKPEDSVFDFPFAFPVIVKPNFGDSAFGITQKSVVNNVEQLLDAISDVRERFGYDRPILVEEFLPGKDLSLGVIGNPPGEYAALPITEEDYSSLPEGLPKIFGYEAQWLPDSPYWKVRQVQAVIPEETLRSITDWSIKLFERLGCRDFARLDWRTDASGAPKLLEVNPSPGWGWDGHMAIMASLCGWSYPQLLEKMLKTAEQRLGLTLADGKPEEGFVAVKPAALPDGVAGSGGR